MSVNCHDQLKQKYKYDLIHVASPVGRSARFACAKGWYTVHVVSCIPLFARVRRRRKIFCYKWYTTYIKQKGKQRVAKYDQNQVLRSSGSTFALCHSQWSHARYGAAICTVKELLLSLYTVVSWAAVLCVQHWGYGYNLEFRLIFRIVASFKVWLSTFQW